MGRTRLPPEQKKVQLNAYVLPEVAGWLESVRESQAATESGAVTWALEVVRYCLRELGDRVGDVYDRNGALMGVELGRAARASLERQRPIPMAVKNPIKSRK